jgi:alkylation response protein AidB-like acyl-CoA dehydrogenase
MIAVARWSDDGGVVPTTADVVAGVRAVAEEWRADRKARQARRHLEQADFDRLRDAGLLRLIAPVDSGGLLDSIEASVRPLCETYRALAGGDPSVALVSSMHPAVVAFWLASPDAAQPAWEEQRRGVFASAATGEQWGTITSEPGSGGDIARTKATAAPVDADPFLPGRAYAVTGDKHFGSGSGVTDRMMTTAVPDGEQDPTIFVLDVRDKPWDGTAGYRLLAEWDGMGMAATQSHAMRLEGAPAIRLAWERPLDELTRAANPLISSLFTAVVLGVLDEAVGLAREQVRARAEGFRAYERVEWARAEQDHWVAVQAYEGALRAVESGRPGVALHDALRAKQAVADLAEATLLRISRVLGGGTFSQRSPFAHWFEDVRALGFLRPPWGLAYDNLFATSIG